MFWLIGAARPATFVELGTHTGFSYFCACQAVERAATGTRCYAIDTWQGDEHAGFYGEDVFRGVTDHNRRYEAFSTLMRMTFDEAVPYFPDGSIDLLHLDGQHYYDDVRHDFEMWRPKLSERSIVLFHDTNVKERDFGVGRLFGEVRSDAPSFEFIHGHGLGVLGTGPDLPDGLEGIMSRAGASTAALEIRATYARLGSAVRDMRDRVELEAHAAQLRTAISERDAELAQIQTTLAARDTELVQQRTAISERDAELTQMQTTLAARDAELTQMQTTLAARDTELAQQRTAFAERDAAPQRRHGLLSRPRGLLKSLAKPATFVQKWRRVRRDRSLVQSSNLFDRQWYLVQYPDVADSGIDPVFHYLWHGAAEGRDPSPRFSTLGYQAHYPDVKLSTMTPLVHYIRHGRSEGRRAQPGADDEDAATDSQTSG